LDFLSERDVSVVIGGTTVTGSSAGVDANGALVLRTADGEVTVRDGTVANWSRVD
jgi:biotin-(acetyl-CoA carboxylase) ligase